MIVSMLAAVALMADAPAAAAPAQAAPPAAADKPAKKEGLVCHKEAELGTRFTKKVCMTKAQAEERRRTDQADIYRAQQTAPAPSN